MKNISSLVKTRILFLSALMSAGFVSLSSNQAATITITNINDSGPGSLRQALVDANDGDTIQFVDNRPLRIDLTSGELLVNKTVTITATSAKLVVSRAGAAPAFRIFHIAPGKRAGISRLNILNGAAQTNGGGVYNDHAELTMTSCLVQGNTAGSGGGIYNDGFLTINYCLVRSNSASSGGGGIANSNTGQRGHGQGDAELTINNSTVSDNRATAGGGIYSGVNDKMAIVKINNCTIAGNTANSGGGVYNVIVDGRNFLWITNSTLSGNSASAAGGGIYTTSNFASRVQEVVIGLCTLSGNSAVLGGGIDNLAYAAQTFIVISDTILKTGASGENIVSGGAFASGGYNLSNDSGGGFLNQPGDQINTDPMLGPLQDNGGPPTLLTHAPLPGSPAINMGFPNYSPPPEYDQRGPGYPRVVNGRLDIGAIEVQAPPVRPTPTPRPTPPPRP